ncbi:MAG: hypothetical protein ACMXYK_04910 [Candidatus Woesearchaeota archaeon]
MVTTESNEIIFENITQSEIFRILLETKLDTAIKFTAPEINITMPGLTSEGATGDLDDKGSIFLPSGYVYFDKKGKRVEPERINPLTKQTFRDSIYNILKHEEGATLISKEGIAKGVSLPDKLISIAILMEEVKRSVLRRNKMRTESLEGFNSDHFCRTYSPHYVHPTKERDWKKGLRPHYGERTSISATLGSAMGRPGIFNTLYTYENNLRPHEKEEFRYKLIQAQETVISEDGHMLFPPYMFIGHSTRYQKLNAAGIVRILGFRQTGRFATFTIEQRTENQMAELQQEFPEVSESHILAHCDKHDLVGIITMYPKKELGKRRTKEETDRYIINHQTLGIDTEKIKEEAIKRYKK